MPLEPSAMRCKGSPEAHWTPLRKPRTRPLPSRTGEDRYRREGTSGIFRSTSARMCVIGRLLWKESVRRGGPCAGVFGPDGRMLGRAERVIARPLPDHAEQSLEDIWSAVARSVREARANAGVTAEDMAGLSFRRHLLTGRARARGPSGERLDHRRGPQERRGVARSSRARRSRGVKVLSAASSAMKDDSVSQRHNRDIRAAVHVYQPAVPSQKAAD